MTGDSLCPLLRSTVHDPWALSLPGNCNICNLRLRFLMLEPSSSLADCSEPPLMRFRSDLGPTIRLQPGLRLSSRQYKGYPTSQVS